MKTFMQEAIEEAYRGISKKHGGPFGTVIVKDGKIIARGHNRVLKKQDPTCHGEIEAIRAACKKLGTFDLTGCDLYTTAEPCPMCLGASMWANIKNIFYGCNANDTDKIGFRDEKFYDFLKGNGDTVVLKETERDECLKLFEDYANLGAKRY